MFWYQKLEPILLLKVVTYFGIQDWKLFWLQKQGPIAIPRDSMHVVLKTIAVNKNK